MGCTNSKPARKPHKYVQGRYGVDLPKPQNLAIVVEARKGGSAEAHIVSAQPLAPAPAYPGQVMPPFYVMGQPIPVTATATAVEAQPVAYYAPPTGYEPPPYTAEAVLVVAEVVEEAPKAPCAELTVDLSNGSLTSTTGAMAEVDKRGTDKVSVTHLCLVNNDLEQVDVALAELPNLLRLSLRTNSLKSFSLPGVRFLRWIDVSNNDLVTLAGVVSDTVEWINAETNDIKDLTGCFVPNCACALLGLLRCALTPHSSARSLSLSSPSGTWLDVSNNSLTSLRGASSFTSLRSLNASKNDLTDISKDLLGCKNLQEVDLHSNDIGAGAAAIMQALAALPNMFGIDLHHNDMGSGAANRAKQNALRAKPDLVIDVANN